MNSISVFSDFDFAFLKLENKIKNMIYSPLSIRYALNMLQEGAKGNTYTEINHLIGNSTLPTYSNIDGKLSMANALFIMDDFYEDVLDSYIKVLKEKYESEVKRDEFKNANSINEWIKEKTLGIIKDMVKDKEVQSSVIVLINALAIEMNWQIQFNYDSTYGRTFYKADGEEMLATTMTNTRVVSDQVGYSIDEDLTVLSMNLSPYEDKQLEFMAIMPKEDLKGFVENVTKDTIESIDEHLILSSELRSGVNIHIPKFKFSYDLGLKDDLMELGIHDAFDKVKADFTKMAIPSNPDEKILVSNALHKADIDFTEKGVKAAAVTMVIMTKPTAATRPILASPVDVIIDRPFLFMIRDKVTKDIWFTGTVYEHNS